MASQPKKSDVNEDLVRNLAKLLDETGLNEIEYGRDGWHVRVVKVPAGGGTVTPAMVAPLPEAATSPSAPPAAGGVVETLSEGATIVTSPMVGVVYNAPEPCAEMFVQVGDEVVPGQTLFLIEAMKVYNPIVAPRAGRVSRILVNNGAPVEYDEPLLVIE